MRHRTIHVRSIFDIQLVQYVPRYLPIRPDWQIVQIGRFARNSCAYTLVRNVSSGPRDSVPMRNDLHTLLMTVHSSLPWIVAKLQEISSVHLDLTAGLILWPLFYPDLSVDVIRFTSVMNSADDYRF